MPSALLNVRKFPRSDKAAVLIGFLQFSKDLLKMWQLGSWILDYLIAQCGVDVLSTTYKVLPEELSTPSCSLRAILSQQQAAATFQWCHSSRRTWRKPPLQSIRTITPVETVPYFRTNDKPSLAVLQEALTKPEFNALCGFFSLCWKSRISVANLSQGPYAEYSLYHF